MTINSQLSTTEPKKKKKTKRRTRTGTESQKWISYRGLSAGKWSRQNGGKGTENQKHKWQVQNRGRLRIIQEMEKPKNVYVQSMDMNQGDRSTGGRGGTVWKGVKGRKKWDSCNSTINILSRIYFFFKKESTYAHYPSDQFVRLVLIFSFYTEKLRR